MSDVNQEAKDSSVPRDESKATPVLRGNEAPERVWLGHNDLRRIVYHPHLAQGVVAAVAPDEQSLQTMKPAIEYIRADLVAPQVPATIEDVVNELRRIREITASSRSYVPQNNAAEMLLCFLTGSHRSTSNP